MRTTFDLPADVAAVLRKESARRGGQAKVPMVKLISDAVRQVYGPRPRTGHSRVVSRPGCGLVRMPAGVVITSAAVAEALDEMP